MVRWHQPHLSFSTASVAIFRHPHAHTRVYRFLYSTRNCLCTLPRCWHCTHRWCWYRRLQGTGCKVGLQGRGCKVGAVSALSDSHLALVRWCGVKQASWCDGGDGPDALGSSHHTHLSRRTSARRRSSDPWCAHTCSLYRPVAATHFIL